MVNKDIKAILNQVEKDRENSLKKLKDNKEQSLDKDCNEEEQDPVQKAIIVGCALKPDSLETVQKDLEELGFLLSTLNIKVEGSYTQKLEKFNSKSLIGSGKIEEIKKEALEKKVDMIVFDRELSPVQVRHLEDILKLKVIDRTGIILEIFAKHARTNYAKTQVELSQLEYLLPRMSGAWTHFQRQQGGMFNRGMGEKQIEIDRRRARDRIAKLKKQLLQFDKEKLIQRKSRKEELKVAIVGYTNSGKTTLMNALTKENLLAKNELFATLDTSVRVIDPASRPKILLSDTVGFIKNLPHSLIESFKSTLAEVQEADLLLHVVDVSSSNFKEEMKVTEDVLEEISAQNIPVIHVFNKIDLIDQKEDPFFIKIITKSYPRSICISALDPTLASKVRDHIYEFFVEDFIVKKIKVNSQDTKALSLIYKLSTILDSNYEKEEGFIYFEIRTTNRSYAKIKPLVQEIV